ncbi:MAG: hypothetical protein WCC17_20280 [Candidatus Nitrosopolaris sp.]
MKQTPTKIESDIISRAVLFISALDSAREIISVLANVKLSDIMRKPIEARDLVQIINNDLSSGNYLSA